MTQAKAYLQAHSGVALYLLCALLSILLFSYALHIDDILNDDGMDYIFAAHDYRSGQFESARTFRPEQAFYAQIAIVAEYTGLGTVHAAYGLGLVAQIALMCGFLALIRVLGGGWTTQLLGILVFASLYHLNEFRPHILKGFAFWACQTWALWALIRYVQSARLWWLLAWAALSLASLLYRIEGIAYVLGLLIAVPLIARGRARRRFLLLASLGVAAISVIVAGQLYYQGKSDPGAAVASVNFAPMARLKTELERGQTVIAGLEREKEHIRETLPNKWARDSASHFLIGGLLFQVIEVILSTSNLLLLLLALSVGRPTLLPRANSHKLIAVYFVIGVGVCLYSVASRFFVTERYAFFPALILCLPIPFLLAPLFAGGESLRRRRTLILRALVFVIPALVLLAPALKDDDEKVYIPEAGNWIGKNLPDQEKIYFNDRKIAFYAAAYSNRSFRMAEVSLDSLRQQGYDYAVIHSEEESPQSRHLGDALHTKTQHIRGFPGPKSKRVDVYKLAIEP